ncbi:peroxiredoxin [Methylophilaceae bacterium]|nr:peroxiredoxin [Methylophilaceae bacterium]
MTQVTIDNKVPDFSLQATGDATFSLNDYAGKNIIIYFYPKDSTPGCTNEGIDFTDNYSAFQKLNTEIFGVSRDSIKSHENFKAKYSFPFQLLSDPDEIACNLFDVIKMKNMYGKQVRGVERSTFLIDPDGKLSHEWRGVKVAGHVQEILEILNN